MQDTCGCTFSTSKICFLLPMHLVFVDYEEYSKCFEDALQSLVEVFAKHVLSSESTSLTAKIWSKEA